MDSISQNNGSIKRRNAWLTSLLIVIVGIEFLLILYFINYLPWTSDFHSKEVKGIANFQYRDTITCNVAYSTYRNDTGLVLDYYDEKQFSVSGLETDTPKMILNSEVSINSEKIFESPDYVTIQNTPAWWNMDTFILRKSDGTYIRTMGGENGGEQYAIAQKGWCE
ncbi:MAG: hypothetical protein WCT33_04190 [Patescibacteria group bacterium]|jgi:hypothetical protein